MRKLILLIMCLSLVSLAACSNQAMVVLLPDPNGHVGQVEVTNKDGSQENGPGLYRGRSEMEGKAPAPPEKIELGEVRRIFGDAMEAAPEAPVRFMLYFDLGQTTLVPESKKLMHTVIWTIKDRGSRDISVVGHSDTYGAEQPNIVLSTRRAQAVADAMTAEGIPAANIEITSYGERYPIVPTGDQVKEPKNRRVEVTVR